MTEREALKLALEALQFKNILNMCGKYSTVDAEKAAIAQTAIKQVLAQPEQEPVIDKSAAVRIATSLGWEPKRKPLTDVEIWNTYKNLWMFHPAEEPRLAGDVLKFARAIEAAHGIKEYDMRVSLNLNVLSEDEYESMKFVSKQHPEKS